MAGRPSNRIANPPNRIREVREAAGKTQEEVGRQIGVTGATVNKYETGEVQVSVHQLTRIARALSTVEHPVPAHALINDYDKPRNDVERSALAILRRLSPTERQRALLVLTAMDQADQQIRRSG